MTDRMRRGIRRDGRRKNPLPRALGASGGCPPGSPLEPEALLGVVLQEVRASVLTIQIGSAGCHQPSSEQAHTAASADCQRPARGLSSTTARRLADGSARGLSSTPPRSRASGTGVVLHNGAEARRRVGSGVVLHAASLARVATDLGTHMLTRLHTVPEITLTITL